MAPNPRRIEKPYRVEYLTQDDEREDVWIRWGDFEKESTAQSEAITLSFKGKRPRIVPNPSLEKSEEK